LGVGVRSGGDVVGGPTGVGAGVTVVTVAGAAEPEIAGVTSTGEALGVAAPATTEDADPVFTVPQADASRNRTVIEARPT
jgi:hypothetical protein